VSAQPSYEGVVRRAYVVTEQLDGCHPLHAGYPLLPGDLLKRDTDGTYAKIGPGLGIFGFVLTAEQQATLQATIEPIPFAVGGMDWWLGG
jgi:hypothetical protein